MLDGKGSGRERLPFKIAAGLLDFHIARTGKVRHLNVSAGAFGGEAAVEREACDSEISA